MKKILLFFVLLTSVKVFSQDIPLDAVYFKDGTRMIGIVTELIPGTSLKITDRNGKDFTFSMAIVDHIEKENYNRDEYLVKPKTDLRNNSLNRVTNLTKIGAARNVIENKYNFSVANVLSYQYTYSAVGIGVSYLKNDSNTFIPIYLDLRYTFNYPSIKPYFYGDVGYSISNEISRGVYFGLGSGLKVNINNTVNLIFEFGYSYQRIGYRLYNFDITGYKDFISFNTGIQF